MGDMELWTHFFRGIADDISSIEYRNHDIEIYERLVKSCTVLTYILKDSDITVLGQECVDLITDLLDALREITKNHRPTPSTIGRISTYRHSDAQVGQPKISISQEQVSMRIILKIRVLLLSELIATCLY